MSIKSVIIYLRQTKNIAHNKNESKDIGQFNTIKVHKCIPAIEVAHLCKNESFQVPQELDIPIGFGVFWEIIVPLVIDAAEIVGCKYVYLLQQIEQMNKEKIQIESWYLIIRTTLSLQSAKKLLSL